MTASEPLASAPVADTSILEALEKVGDAVLWLLTPLDMIQLITVWEATGQW